MEARLAIVVQKERKMLGSREYATLTTALIQSGRVWYACETYLLSSGME